MPTLSIRFTGGHYHATPWGHHANEGGVEWPPSPWRLLRAMISTGYTKLPEWQAGILPENARAVLIKLTGVLPSYRLPPAIGTHTRHYMPTRANPTLVLDARAVTGSAPVLIQWDVVLEPDELTLLTRLVDGLGYLGRAESWTDCKLLQDAPRSGTGWVMPCGSSEPPGRGWEQVALMAPVMPTEYTAWRESKVVEVLAGLELPTGGKPPAKLLKKRQKAVAPYPEDILACLQAETGWLQKEGWSQPPGSRCVLYWQPANAIVVAAPQALKPMARKPVPFALLALAASARSRSVLPRYERTLPQADLLHQALASHVGRLETPDAFELIGKDEHGHPLMGHRHAHLLPLALLNNDKHLDHVLVWAPDGLGNAAQNILRKLRKTYMKGGVGELAVRFAGSGTAPDMRGIEALRPVFGPSRVWHSLTPLVLPRHRKKSGRNSPEGQIRAELAERGFSDPVAIEWLKDESVAMRHFVRTRRNRPPPPENFGYALRLTFAEPVSGPIALGYAAHYGLGLFKAADPQQ